MPRLRIGRIGAKVRWKHQVAKIIHQAPDIAPGAVVVSPPFEHAGALLSMWNMNELTYVRKK